MTITRNSGFTLIELMITVVIIGLLAAIVIPNYSDYVLRGKIPEATGNLSSMRVKLEQYYQDNRNYGSDNDSCPVSASDAKHFSYTCNWGAGGSDQSYLLTANGISAQGTGGFSYTIDQNGAKGSTAWGSTSTTCWITKKGGAC